ncbi:MAG: class I SAM-dependent methyltransferase [Gammaproteobacteria bacterium]
MKRLTLVEQAHVAVLKRLHPGQTAIDATVGNGHDTLFLAQCVGAQGRVYGFDIQEAALTATRSRLAGQDYDNSVSLIHDSHARLKENIPDRLHGRIDAVMFNLGYLPRSAKTVITESASTLAALEASLAILAPNGVITVLAYPGHAGGKEEKQCVQQWFEQLDSTRLDCRTFYGAKQSAGSPILFVIEGRDQ